MRHTAIWAWCCKNRACWKTQLPAILKGWRSTPDPIGHFNLGTALRDQGKHAEAGQSYLKALAMKPDYADVHNNLGEIFRDQGNMDDAIKSYQTAISIQPDHRGANYNMAEFLYLAKKFEQARPYFERSRFLDWRKEHWIAFIARRNMTSSRKS